MMLTAFGSFSLVSKFTPVCIPNQNTYELRINVNTMSKKLNISYYMDFMFQQKAWKSRREKNHHELVHVG